ncbi:MAG: hypothetical protein KJ566_02840 [Nanoarchaeota archaeon]|nr:hypothetical protein [Nanoarchaeota archaeon]
MDKEITGIRAVMILEIIGKPAEHLVSTLEDFIKKIGEEKKTQVISKKIAEPIFMKDSKEFYTTHAEVEVEVEEVLYLAMLMFKYMPAHIEVISPELIALTNNGWGEILSELTRRLHGYNEVARVLQNEKIILENKLKEVMEIKEEKGKKK